MVLFIPQWLDEVKNVFTLYFKTMLTSVIYILHNTTIKQNLNPFGVNMPTTRKLKENQTKR